MKFIRELWTFTPIYTTVHRGRGGSQLKSLGRGQQGTGRTADCRGSLCSAAEHEGPQASPVFSPEFFKAFWAELSEDILLVFSESLKDLSLPQSCKRAVIILLPKKWQLLQFIGGQAKLPIYESRKNQVAGDPGEEVLALFIQRKSGFGVLLPHGEPG